MDLLDLPDWFILITFLFGCTFIFLGYRLLFKKQISLLGGYAKYRDENEKALLCKYVGNYMIGLGIVIFVLPVFNLYFATQNLLLFVGAVFALSVIFWTIISKKVKIAN